MSCVKLEKIWLQIFAYVIVVRFVPLVIDHHNLGYRIWPSLAQHSITQVMIYNLGYDL